MTIDTGATGVSIEDEHFALPDDAADSDERFASSLVAVGSRLRDIRREAKLSLRDLATESGLSPSFLSLVERGECSLSLTSLFSIAHALKIDPSAVLNAASTPPQPKAEYGLWRGVQRSVKHTVVGEREYFPFAADIAGGTMNPMYFRMQPTSTIAPAAVHEGEEVAYVVSGTLWIRLREDEIDLGPGDAIHFSSMTPHSIANRTSQVVEALWLTTNRSDTAQHHRS
ncbi:helix-turn-helix domain-containing protein [Leifsonia sp. NPDC058230]|uniref:helix-turn-helix domain-containing protein n=1 Tax=Leifsonia sp. NPDC058230 TaxID=3346391 RepID=UPI0036D97C1D